MAKPCASEVWQVVSAFVALAGPLTILAYDVVAYRAGGRDATISAVVSYWASKWPELPAIAAGVFVWLWFHLFLQASLDAMNKRHPPPVPPAIKNGLNGKG